MTRRAYRLIRPEYTATAFTGEGARLYGGRWNSRGVAVVYAAESLSLAQLELLVRVHSREILENQFVCIAAEYPEELALPVSDLGTLPEDWAKPMPSSSTQAIGDRWVREQRSMALWVPSVLTAGEFNLVFNPVHPDFARLEVFAAVPFRFDPRLASTPRLA